MNVYLWGLTSVIQPKAVDHDQPEASTSPNHDPHPRPSAEIHIQDHAHPISNPGSSLKPNAPSKISTQSASSSRQIGCQVYVRKRPGLEEFMNTVSKLFEAIVVSFGDET